MDFSTLIKKYKKKPIVDFNSKSFVNVNYKKQDIMNVIPNRDPFLFIDEITGIDLSENLIVGSKKIDENDPIFKGHFPGLPVYPGVLQLEMISEIFCCLYYFVSKKTTKVLSTGPINLRATRMHDALLQYGLFPGDEVQIAAKVIENNGLTFCGIGQIIKGNQIPVLVIGEFYIIE
jgi:3-hydroxyacyl-[acyl-carrier-protein] dehydratase